MTQNIIKASDLKLGDHIDGCEVVGKMDLDTRGTSVELANTFYADPETGAKLKPYRYQTVVYAPGTVVMLDGED